MFVDCELVRVRATVVANSDGLTTPDEFCAAEAEMFPSSKRQLSGPAIACAVPSFHRLNCKPISQVNAAPLDWLCERITKFVVAGNLNLQFCEVGAKSLDVSETAEMQTGQVGRAGHLRASLSHSSSVLTGLWRFRRSLWCSANSRLTG